MRGGPPLEDIFQSELIVVLGQMGEYLAQILVQDIPAVNSGPFFQNLVPEDNFKPGIQHTAAHRNIIQHRKPKNLNPRV